MSTTEKSVVASLKQSKGQTAKELGVPLAVCKALMAEEVIKVVSTRKHQRPDGQPGRGRPSFEFALTKKGRDRARRIPVTA